jgi:hypothetical protein
MVIVSAKAAVEVASDNATATPKDVLRIICRLLVMFAYPLTGQ